MLTEREALNLIIDKDRKVLKTDSQVILEGSDIQIGAVELKDSNTENRASIDIEGNLMVSSNGKHIFAQVFGATLNNDVILQLDTFGLLYIDIWIEITSATDIKIEFSNDNINWVTFAEINGTEYKETLISAFRYIKATLLNTGDISHTANVVLSAKGI